MLYESRYIGSLLWRFDIMESNLNETLSFDVRRMCGLNTKNRLQGWIRASRSSGLDRGVWFSNEPLPYGDGPTLWIEVPDQFQVLYEVVYEEGRGPGSREFLLPAEIANQFHISVLEEE